MTALDDPRAASGGPEPTLKRRLGLGLLTLYGVGVMVGAGIYVLVGEVAAEAGRYAPLSFLLAGVAAAFDQIRQPTCLAADQPARHLSADAGERNAQPPELTPERFDPIGIFLTYPFVIAAAGDLEIRGVEGAREVLVRAMVCASRETWASDADVEVDGGATATVAVRLPERTGSSSWFGKDYLVVDLELEVPATLALTVQDSSGDIAITGTGTIESYFNFSLHKVSIRKSENHKVIAQVFLGTHGNFIFPYPCSGSPDLLGSKIACRHR